MFGKAMSIACKEGIIHLKPFRKEEVACDRVCEMLSDHEVTRYILMQGSPRIEDEEEFYEKIRKNEELYIWGIYLEDSPLLGFTDISIIFPNHMGSTGFMLFDKSYWRKGIASTSHIARTHFAVNSLDLKTIVSGVLSPNLGSMKALQKVGYFVTGYKLAERYRDGIYRHHIDLQWICPGYEKLILADDTPDEIRNRAERALGIAQETLKRGDKEVSYSVNVRIVTRRRKLWGWIKNLFKKILIKIFKK